MDNHFIALEARRAELHAQVHRAAFLHYVRKGRIPRDVAEMVAATGSWQELLAWRARRNGKYNPNWQSQPRVPTGSTGGGQWTDGGGSGETARPVRPKRPGSAPMPARKPPAPKDPAQEPMEPGLERVYIVEALVGGLGAVGVRGVVAAARIVMGVARAAESSYKIRRAAKAIEDYLGGRPDRAFLNRSGDIIIIRGSKKVRFDINNYSPHEGPHFHFQRKTPGGNWVQDGKEPRYYFKPGD